MAITSIYQMDDKYSHKTPAFFQQTNQYLYRLILNTVLVYFHRLIFLCQLTGQSADIMASLCGVRVCIRMNNFSSITTRPRDMLFFWVFLCQLTCQSADIMASLCGVRVCVRVRVTNFFSKTTRPRDMLFFFKDTLTIEDDKS